MQPIVVSVGPLDAAAADAIAAAQTLAIAGNLTLTATPYVLDAPRRVIITSVGNDSGVIFTITGTTFGGHEVSEEVTGANAGIASSTIDFATVTSIYADGATADDVEAGTSEVAGSSWVRMDSWAAAQSAVQVNVTGTVNYSIQTTMDDPNDPSNPTDILDVVWLDALDANLVSESTSKSGYFNQTPTFVRLLLNSGTGSAKATIAQFGNATY